MGLEQDSINSSVYGQGKMTPVYEKNQRGNKKGGHNMNIFAPQANNAAGSNVFNTLQQNSSANNDSSNKFGHGPSYQSIDHSTFISQNQSTAMNNQSPPNYLQQRSEDQLANQNSQDIAGNIFNFAPHTQRNPHI